MSCNQPWLQDLFAHFYSHFLELVLSLLAWISATPSAADQASKGAVSPLRVLPVQHVGTQSARQRERERLNSTLRWSIYQPLWNNVMSTSPKMIATQPQAKHVRQKCFGGGREVSKAICQIALPMIELLIWMHTYAKICLLRENYSVFRCAMKHRLLWERIRQIKRDPF